MEIVNGWVFTKDRQINLSNISDISLKESTLYFYHETNDKETHLFHVFSTTGQAQAAFDAIENYLKNIGGA